jgi:hypothetical protein
MTTLPKLWLAWLTVSIAIPAFAAVSATHSDRRLFICDGANDCVRSLKLGYHTTERIRLGEKKGR